MDLPAGYANVSVDAVVSRGVTPFETAITGDMAADHNIFPAPALDSPTDIYVSVSATVPLVAAGNDIVAAGLSLAPAPADDAAV
jgi:hypothetical protein